MTGKNRIMIYGPKGDGAYVVEFRTADGDVLSISIPRTRGPSNGHRKVAVVVFGGKFPTPWGCSPANSPTDLSAAVGPKNGPPMPEQAALTPRSIDHGLASKLVPRACR